MEDGRRCVHSEVWWESRWGLRDPPVGGNSQPGLPSELLQGAWVLGPRQRGLAQGAGWMPPAAVRGSLQVPGRKRPRPPATTARRMRSRLPAVRRLLLQPVIRHLRRMQRKTHLLPHQRQLLSRQLANSRMCPQSRHKRPPSLGIPRESDQPRIATRYSSASSRPRRSVSIAMRLRLACWSRRSRRWSPRRRRWPRRTAPRWHSRRHRACNSRARLRTSLRSTTTSWTAFRPHD